MAGEKPGPLTRLRKLCDEMESEIGRHTALMDHHLPAIFFTMNTFIIDIRKCADEIDEIISRARAKMKDRLQNGSCKTE